MCLKYRACSQNLAASRYSLSKQMCVKYRACTQKLASRNSPADLPFPAEVAYGLQLATPLPRAEGYDDMSSKETPPN